MPRNSEELRYSYNLADRSGAKYHNKNFNKTQSFNSKFVGVTFLNTSFVGAKFKFCNMNQTVFDGCLIQGALFRRCDLSGVKFSNCIIVSVRFDRTSLKDCEISKSIILSSPLGGALDESNLISTELIQNYYSEQEFSGELLRSVRGLKGNEFISRSSVLHRKAGKINTISLKVLVREFGEQFLIEKLPLLNNLISKDFYTLSYLEVALNKIKRGDIV